MSAPRSGAAGLAALDDLSDADRALACLIGLACLPGIGPAVLGRCQAQGGAERHWRHAVAGRALALPVLAGVARHVQASDPAEGAQVLARVAATVDPVAHLVRHRAAGHHLLVPGGPGYPTRLVSDPAPPGLLFAAGDLAVLERRTVALVGTRNATRTGRLLAADLAAGLSQAGVAVVSGLALGIDGAAHQAVVDLAGERAAGPAGGLGPPLGVIASGLDIAYPRRHRDLHRAVAAHGLLLTETPLGGRPVPWRFPARNRVIAALAEAVVVVESRSKGGSMLTAGEALDRGVPVLAVPGHPTAPAAAGANDLLFDGASPVRSVDDVLGALGLAGLADPGRSRRTGPAPEPGDQSAVAEALAETPRSLGEVVAATGLDLDRASVALAELEVAGLVARQGPWFERIGR